MNLGFLIEQLNGDLSREYAHWHYYMNAAVIVQGLHRAELQEFLLASAASEMKHIEEWGKLILGLGGKPVVFPAYFRDDLADPQDILEIALQMEEEVVSNYILRMEQAAELQENQDVDDRVNGRYVEVFLEDQLMDSRTDIDNLREMIKLPPPKADIKCKINLPVSNEGFIVTADPNGEFIPRYAGQVT